MPLIAIRANRVGPVLLNLIQIKIVERRARERLLIEFRGSVMGHITVLLLASRAGGVLGITDRRWTARVGSLAGSPLRMVAQLSNRTTISACTGHRASDIHAALAPRSEEHT